MATLSFDIRQRILASYDNAEGSRVQIAARFRVSEGMVKKLLQQRRRTGCIRSRHQLAGRKPSIVAAHRMDMRRHLKDKPDLTLAELRDAVGLTCTLPALHYVLVDMGLTYKKRRSGQPNKIVRTSKKLGESGDEHREASSRRGSSFSMKPGQKPT
jgi:transposase